MTLTHSTESANPRTDSFRWDQQHMASVFDHFDQRDPAVSQRHFAQQHDIPRSTLGYWLRQDTPEGVDPVLVSFFRSRCGLALLRRIVLALFLVFHFRGSCGLRSLGLFLHLSHLDRFVASSHGVLHGLARSIEADLAAFDQIERARLAVSMPHKDIALVADEHFHAGHPCLIAIEPASNFILVEQYTLQRDAATWATVLSAAIENLPVEVVLLTSDQAKGIIACANSGLQAQHLPELFHGQRDLAIPFTAALERRKASAEKELREDEKMLQYWRDEQAKAEAERRAGRPMDYAWRIDTWVAWVGVSAEQVKVCELQQQQAADAVTGLADDYHPFDSQTGAAVSAADMQRRLETHLGTLTEVAEQAELGSKATAATSKASQWVGMLVAALGWFRLVATTKVEELELSQQAEQAVNEELLPGLYWQQAARRGRTADERRQRQELSEGLLEQAWRADGPLSQLTKEERAEVQRVSKEIVGLFARSSSCVEGRNGRLSLLHHGQCRLGTSRLKALTSIHNYLSEREDGTTAAERFFGQKPRDLFGWLLDRLPNLPRPAQQRRKTDAQGPHQTSQRG